MRTDLYHSHSKTKDIRFPCDRTTSHHNLRRGPCGNAFVFLTCGFHSANNREKLKIGQTSVVIVTNENSGLAKGYRWGPNRSNENTYPIQAPVYDVIRVKIVETFGYIQYLDRVRLPVKCDAKKRLTRLIRFAPGFFSTNSVRVPFGIHSETICKGSVVTPKKGTMFGCLNRFHIMAASKNDYNARGCF